MERAIVHGVHASPTAAKITVTGVPDCAAAAVFRALAEVDLGLVSLNATALAFTVARSAGPAVLDTLRTARPRIGFDQVHLDDHAAVITLTGAGLRSDPTIPATFCEVLARGGVHLELVSIENSRLSAACGEHELGTAVRALCEAFEVGATTRATVLATRRVGR